MLLDFLWPSVCTIGIYNLLDCLLEKVHVSKNILRRQWDVQTCLPAFVLVRKSLSWEEAFPLSCYQLLCFKHADCLVAFGVPPGFESYVSTAALHSSSVCAALSQLFQCSLNNMVESHLVFILRCMAVSKTTAREDEQLCQ